MMEIRRIRIYPASREQMEKAIAAETDGDTRKAYNEMLEGCLAHTDQWEWYAMWMIEKTDGTHVGDLCFKGLKADCNPEIGYGILEEFRGQGFATEAVKLALLWAFRHPDVNAIEAETDPYNAASAKVLMKCGFRPNGEAGEEGPRYIVNRGANRPVGDCSALHSALIEVERRTTMDTKNYTIRLEKEDRQVRNKVS